jgi:hypothetical protein
MVTETVETRSCDNVKDLLVVLTDRMEKHFFPNILQPSLKVRHPPIYLLLFLTSVYQSTYPLSVRLSVYVSFFTRLSIRPPVYPPARPSTYPSVCRYGLK